MLHIVLPPLRLTPSVVIPPCQCELSAGEVLYLQGPNGVGKTTLLRAIVGIERQVGDVRYRAGNAWLDLEVGSGWVAYLGHHHGLQWDVTVSEQVDITLDAWSVVTPAPEMLLKASGLMRLRHRTIRKLSAGQKRRLALALLQALPAQLWVLDEPLAGLDVGAMAWWERCCEAHLQQGGIIIVTTHQPWPWLQSQNPVVLTLEAGAHD